MREEVMKSYLFLVLALTYFLISGLGRETQQTLSQKLLAPQPSISHPVLTQSRRKPTFITHLSNKLDDFDKDI